jgi:hypothetical protein
MEKTRLWELWLQLTPPERRQMALWVASPFFNQQANLVLLAEYLNQCIKVQQPPDTQVVFARIFPNQPYHDPKMRVLNSDLLALTERYLIWQEQERQQQEAVLLSAAYRRRGLERHFQAAMREARHSVQQQAYRHADYYECQQSIAWEQYQFSVIRHRTEVLNLQENSDLMDTVFVLRKLRLACLMLSHQAVFSTQYQMGVLLDTVLVHAEHHAPANPSISLYYDCYCFLKGMPDAALHFARFRETLQAHQSCFPTDELRTLFLLAINYGIKRINETRPEWLSNTLELYRSALDLQLLLENGHLSRHAFNNICAIALRLSEMDWTEQFILQYKNKLERPYREAAASLNLARLAYQRRDFATALLHLQRSDYSDLINNLMAKTLLLKIYYETHAFDSLESHLASMQNYIRRHTSIGYHRTNFTKIIHYTKALMQLLPNDKATKVQLRQQIEAEPVLSEKVWFLAQLT